MFKSLDSINVFKIAESMVPFWWKFQYDEIRKTYEEIPKFQRNLFIHELARLLKNETNSISYKKKDIESIIKYKIGVSEDVNW